MSWEDEKLVIAGREFNSRLIVGTGKYKDYAENAAAAEAAGPKSLLWRCDGLT